ncbi:MAG: hypothetical protein H0T84_03140 [Tatlockia sp.]|nr:hypothetical protein [Tatlockia sp.]
MKIKKNSIYFKAVLESSLIFKIKNVASSLFNIWAKQAKQHYSDYLFKAEEETIANDLIVALAKGLELIGRHENLAKQSVEFFFDAVSSSLRMHWSQEYIYKQSNAYKELCFLQSLTQFLKIDQVAIMKVEILYNHIINKEKIILEQSSKKNDKVIDLNQFKMDKHSDKTFKKNITTYLESIFYEKHFHIFGDILKNKYSLVLADFFNPDDIRTLIATLPEINRPS